MTSVDKNTAYENCLRLNLRILDPQASKIEEMAKANGLTTPMTARILINKALAAGITV